MILLFPLFHLNSISFKRCVATVIDNLGIGIIISVSLQISVSGFLSALFAKMRNEELFYEKIFKNEVRMYEQKITQKFYLP